MTKSSTSFNKQLLDYWGFIKEMYYWRGSPWLFSSNGYREQRKFMRIETEKKNALVLRQWPDLHHFSKVSKRTNPEWHFKIFTFASQRRLLELLSYGEYNHLYFSVTCFLKTTHLSVIVFSHSFFVSYFEKTSAYVIFQKLKNIDYSYIVLKHWII